MRLTVKQIRFWIYGTIIGVFIASTAGAIMASSAMHFFATGAVQSPLSSTPPSSATSPPTSNQPSQTGNGSVGLPITTLPSPLKGDGKDVNDKPRDLWTAISSIITALAWPVATFLLLRLVLKTPQVEIFLNYLYRRTSQISILGLEIKLSNGAEATLTDVKSLITKIPESHQTWVHNTHLLEQMRNVVADLRDYLTVQQKGHPRSLADVNEIKELRFTIHVPDIVFTHSLRQLVDYMGCGRGGAGRLFSARRGIIGLAWRLQKSRRADRGFTEDELVELWGMTRLEANDTSSGKNLLWAFVLKDTQEIPIGLLYVDGKIADTSIIISDDGGKISETKHEITDFFSPQRIGSISKEQAFEKLGEMVQLFAMKRGLIRSLRRLDDARAKVTQLDIFAR